MFNSESVTNYSVIPEFMDNAPVSMVGKDFSVYLFVDTEIPEMELSWFLGSAKNGALRYFSMQH
uniref:Uncharacterized protein n=1 Tax=Romanomermis culicivorax TaxID=13658 RepID=A0A915IGB5_ROMCU